MPFNNPIVGGTTLIRQSIKSPDYKAGSQGWTINNDGSAEFNNVTIRGSITENGDFLGYNGTPASGNLVISISPDGGTDSFGNVYPAGVQVGEKSQPNVQIEINNPATGGNLLFNTSSAHQTNPALVSSGIDGSILYAQFEGPIDNIVPGNILTGIMILFSQGSGYIGVGDAQDNVYPSITWNYLGASMVGTVAAVQPNSSSFTNPVNMSKAEYWHSTILNSGWINGGSGGYYYGVRYRLLPTGDLEINGDIEYQSGTTQVNAGTILPITSLPTGWIPNYSSAITAAFVQGSSNSAAFVKVTNSGVIELYSPVTFTGNLFLMFSGTIPMG